MANIIEIHDFSDPALDVYTRLTENQLLNRADPDNALFVAESPLVIGRALDAGCEPVSFLMERQHTQGKGREILARCCQDIPVYTADASVLTQLTGFHLTRGMLCAMRRPKLQSVEDVCRDARRVVVLENVMNPTNIGAIFRSAAALGMDAVLLTTAGSDPLYRRASRVSMGNVFLDHRELRLHGQDPDVPRRRLAQRRRGKRRGVLRAGTSPAERKGGLTC